MRRRSFLALAVGLCLFGVSQAKEPQDNLREVFKIIDGKKIKCRMSELVIKDICSIEEDGKVIEMGEVAVNPSLNNEGHYQIGIISHLTNI